MPTSACRLSKWFTSGASYLVTDLAWHFLPIHMGTYSEIHPPHSDDPLLTSFLSGRKRMKIKYVVLLTRRLTHRISLLKCKKKGKIGCKYHKHHRKCIRNSDSGSNCDNQVPLSQISGTWGLPLHTCKQLNQSVTPFTLCWVLLDPVIYWPCFCPRPCICST